MRAIAALVPAVRERSRLRCEVVDPPGRRCPDRAAEIHHRIPRSRASFRGDHLLDLAGVIHHLADVCLDHHLRAHANPTWGRDVPLADGRAGLVVPGQIRTGPDGTLEYFGPHPEFQAHYPKAA